MRSPGLRHAGRAATHCSASTCPPSNPAARYIILSLVAVSPSFPFLSSLSFDFLPFLHRAAITDTRTGSLPRTHSTTAPQHTLFPRRRHSSYFKMSSFGLKIDVSFSGEFEYPRCSTPVQGSSSKFFRIPELDDDESFDLMQDWDSWLSFKNPGLQELEDADEDSWLMDDSPSFLALKNGASPKVLAGLQAGPRRCPPQEVPARVAPLSNDGGDDTVDLVLSESFEDDEWLMDDSPSFVLFKKGILPRPQVPRRRRQQDADDTVPLGFGFDDDDDDEDLFAVTLGESEARERLRLTRPSRTSCSSSRSCPPVPTIVVTPPVEDCGSDIGERPEVVIDSSLLTVPEVRLPTAAIEDETHCEEKAAEVAAPDDESQPKMKRLMAFWKSVERGEYKGK